MTRRQMLIPCTFVLSALMLFALVPARAAGATAAPQWIRISGSLPGGAQHATVVFALYGQQEGGAALWQEVQSLALDPAGHYTVLLGTRTTSGVPLELFRSGEARWLGVSLQGQPEQPRVLLVSVPYALKAQDAETLGGLPASAFVRSGALTTLQPDSLLNRGQVAAAAAAAASTFGNIPMYLDATSTLGASALNQGTFANNGGTSTGVAVNASAPLATLHLVDSNATMRIDNYAGANAGSPNFNFYSANGSAAVPAGTNAGDNLGQFAATGYIPGTGFPASSKAKIAFVATEAWSGSANGTALSFQTTANGNTSRKERMRVDNSGYVGIGTSAPDQPLTVAGVVESVKDSGGSGGFKFPDGSMMSSAVANNSGVVQISSGGTGQSTQQAAITALTGAQHSGFYLRSDGTNALLFTLQVQDMPATVALTSKSNTFAAAQSISGALTATSVAASGAVNVDSTAANNGTALSPGVLFGSAGNTGIASNQSSSSSNNPGGLDFYTKATRRMAITNAGLVGIGTGTTAPRAQFEVDGAASSGLVGQSYGQSTTAKGYLPTVAGVWGDYGGSKGIGVLGTADNNNAGNFINNSSQYPALWAQNNSTATGVSQFKAGYPSIFEAANSDGSKFCYFDTAGDTVCTGQATGAVKIGSGEQVVALYGVTSAESWAEDFGTATLSRGSATVTLDPTFASTVNTTVDYHVFLTPRGDCKGLYVAQQGAASFEVRELGGGSSGVAFDYRIVAKRAGSEQLRLTDMTERMKQVRSHASSVRRAEGTQ